MSVMARKSLGNFGLEQGPMKRKALVSNYLGAFRKILKQNGKNKKLIC